jgi:hypothetical protein
VIDFLNFIGVDFPRVNEDHVREFARHVRTFAPNIEDTHSAATSTVQRMSGAYTGAPYEALVERWSQMSSSHMQELVDICGTVATALDAAAGYIEGKKYEAIAQLGVMAAAFVADQAAAVATFGLAEAAEAAIVAGAKEITKFLEQELEQYIIGEIIEKAVLEDRGRDQADRRGRRRAREEADQPREPAGQERRQGGGHRRGEERETRRHHGRPGRSEGHGEPRVEEN